MQTDEARFAGSDAHAGAVELSVLGRPCLRGKVDLPHFVWDAELLEQPHYAAASRGHRVVEHDGRHHGYACRSSHSSRHSACRRHGVLAPCAGGASLFMVANRLITTYPA